MEISLLSIKRHLAAFFSRYHFIIITVFLMLSVSYFVYLIYENVQLSDEENGYTAQQSSNSFDEDTINRLRSLKSSDQQTEKLPVSGRVSPF